MLAPRPVRREIVSTVKTPAPPPNSNDLMRRLTEDRRAVDIFLHHSDVGSMSEEYYAWDKLRYKPAPEGLTHEEWWFAVRWARRSAARRIDLLRDVDGQPFSYLLPDQVLRATDQIARDASGHITVSEQVTNPASRDRYIISSLMEEAITSSQLEGASTSRRVAKEMIRSGRQPRDRSERMIFNNFIAMRRVVELQNQPLTPELVCELHRIVTDQALDNPENAGKIQDDDAERIAVYDEGDTVLHRPPPVDELPDRLMKLCEFANGMTDAYMPPVLRAISVHFMMGYDHYFEDGNGRTARVLFYWVMLKNGYWLTEFLAISRILKNAPSQYAQSFLLTEQDEGDLTHFFIYQLKVITRAISELHDYLALKAEELKNLQKAIKATPGAYNYRQLALLEHAVRSAGAVYTVHSHSTSHRTSGETARADLYDLEERGLLVRFKMGRQFAWSAVPNLQETLTHAG